MILQDFPNLNDSIILKKHNGKGGKVEFLAPVLYF